MAKTELRRVCVFCGSSSGSEPAHIELARELGQVLAGRQIGLVYGGGATGLMGAVATAVMEAGGEVVGVIPGGMFTNEIPKQDITELHRVPDMHARKALMYDLADGFIALPGGLGTLEEVFESATWTQLGLHPHDKQVVLLDHDGFWAPLDGFLDEVSALGFIAARNRAILRRATSVADALELLRTGPASQKPPYVA